MPEDSPDIETAAPGYQQRFLGSTGAFFLRIQKETILNLLPESEGHPLRILEIGGGHGQLASALLEAGHEVWVQGSSDQALKKVHSLETAAGGKLHSTVSPMNSLPFEDSFFDVVVNVRVLAHINDISAHLREWTRLARKRLIFDYPPLESFNILYPLLFGVKKRIERSTRSFNIYRTGFLEGQIEALGWEVKAVRRQFLVPMGIHRALNNVSWSEGIENACSAFHITSFLGSPAVIAADPKIEV